MICDTFVPSLESSKWPEFFRRSATQAGIDKELARTIEEEFGKTQSEQMTSLLNLFESPFLNLFLNGTFARFSKMELEEREKYLKGLSSSSLALKRRAFQAIKRLVLFAYYGYIPTGERGNPNWKDIGYMGREPLPPFDSKSIIPIVPETQDQEFECDVCVVGSGSGGSVVAEHLSASGWNVLVIEAGEYLTSEDFTGQEYEMTGRLFEQRGRATTRDLSISLLEGSAVGGGTLVNWNTSIKPESWLRKEWVKEGLHDLNSAAFDSYIEFAWQKLKVNRDSSQLNANNDVLFRGCAALGYKIPEDYDIIWRNAVACDSRCTFCTYGCQYACKQSTAANLLPEAASHGCRFIFNSRVEHVIIQGGRAVGVSAQFREKVNFRVKSKVVVLAAGSINTPAIALRSGLRRNVGRNLLLHPTTAVSGTFEHEVKMWEGPPQTCKVTNGRNLDGQYHGFWLEAVPAHPALFSSTIPWTGGRKHKELMTRIAHDCGTIVLVRDAGSGRVSVDKHGYPECDYKLTEKDKISMMGGMVEASRILAAGGATILSTLHSDGTQVERSNSDKMTTSDLEKFESQVRKRGIVPNKISLFSAHIMGSARMGDERVSFCDENAESYDVPGLFVGDASAFPTAPGINPMITIMSLAKRNAKRIDDILRKIA